MLYHYICETCLTEYAKRPIKELSVPDYQALCAQLAFQVQHSTKDKPEVVCPKCSGDKTKKLLGIDSSYIRGYGYKDKDGAKNDMDLHLMVTDNDPYKEHRQAKDKEDTIRRLQKKKEFDTDSKSINMGS